MGTRIGSFVLGVSLACHAATLVTVAARGGPPGAADSRQEPARRYTGSDSCASCHQDEYAAWKRALHLQMTKPIGEARVLGDFSDGASLAAHGRSYRMEARDGAYFITVSHRGREPERFRVEYTLGAKRFQGYLSTLSDGRIYVLPAFWHVEGRRWIDWKEITPVPDSDHDLRQIWNITCFNCHATNLVKNFDVASKAYATSWTEMGIGCEACHGPGSAHIGLMEEWEKTPASKPAYDRSSTNRELGRLLRVFSPRTADRRTVFDSCSYCHGNKNNVFVGFSPGDAYEDYALPFLVSQPIPDTDPQGEFWPDGRPNRFNRPQALMLSGCFEKSDITCTSCHVGHGSRHEHSLKVAVRDANGVTLPPSDGLCTQCHTTGALGASGAGGAPGAPGATGASGATSATGASGADWTAHTHHPAESPGSRCIECHMSDVNWRLLIRRRDHTFAAPVPEMTATYGVPNACTTCHDSRSPEWAAAVMDRWYGDGARRREAMRLADTMYEAGAGNRSVLRALGGYAVDRTGSPVVRASAVEFIGRLAGTFAASRSTGGSQTSFEGAPSPPAASAGGTQRPVAPEVFDRALYVAIGAASDPEPMVRATAVRTLGLLGDDRAVPPLVARLVDRARTVRVTAAESLLLLGVAALEGSPGQALSRAQDEYADSLASFPDVADRHASIGWLEIRRGRDREAARALKTAIDLDSAHPRPRVLLGVLAARAGRLEEALDAWRAVRRTHPQYPNLDRLIAEAEKQLASRP
jgi:hypothetical protein